VDDLARLYDSELTAILDRLVPVLAVRYQRRPSDPWFDAEAFWKAKVDAERLSPQQIWQSIDALMGRGHSPASSACRGDELRRFFDEKVAGVRRATADAPAPSFSSALPGCSFPGFITLDVNDVIAAVRALPDKQFSLDPMPTSLLKEHIDLLTPFLVELFNRLLSLGVFPASFKIVYITPLLKKSYLDSADVRSYRPISIIQLVSSLQVA